MLMRRPKNTFFEKLINFVQNDVELQNTEKPNNTDIFQNETLYIRKLNAIFN